MTAAVVVPSNLVSLANYEGIKKYDLTSFKAVACGGAIAAPNVIRRIMEKFGVVFVPGMLKRLNLWSFNRPTCRGSYTKLIAKFEIVGKFSRRKCSYPDATVLNSGCQNELEMKRYEIIFAKIKPPL